MVDTDRVMGAARELAGKAQGTIGDLIGSKSDSVEGRFREAQGSAENLYDQAKDSVGHAADQTQAYAEDAYENSGHYLREGRRAVAHRVEESPLVALLIAGAVGYGLALLIHSRR